VVHTALYRPDTTQGKSPTVATPCCFVFLFVPLTLRPAFVLLLLLLLLLQA
jgi:hypothetical protein